MDAGVSPSSSRSTTVVHHDEASKMIQAPPTGPLWLARQGAEFRPSRPRIQSQGFVTKQLLRERGQIGLVIISMAPVQDSVQEPEESNIMTCIAGFRQSGSRIGLPDTSN